MFLMAAYYVISPNREALKTRDCDMGSDGVKSVLT